MYVIKKSIELMKIRSVMLCNFLEEKLYETPSVISMVLLVPIIIYLIVELMIPSDLNAYSINPNIKELFNSFSILFFQMVFYIVLFSSSISMLFSYINIKTYRKYRTMNIPFKSVTLANLCTFLCIFNVLIFFIIMIFLMNTNSEMLPILILSFIILFIVSLIISVLNLLYQMISVLVIRGLRLKYMSLSEMVIVILMTLIIQNVMKYFTFDIAMNTPFIFIVIFLISLLLVVGYLYHILKIDSRYILRKSNKVEKAILKQCNVKIINNYLLLLYTSRKIYLEYIFSLGIFLFFSQMMNQIAIDSSIIFQLIILMFLISSGLITSYEDWYALRERKYFKKMLNFDTVVSLVVLFVVSTALSFVLYQNGLTQNVMISCIVFVLINYAQRFVKLKYKADNNHPLIFFMTYGIMIFMIFETLKGIFRYV